MDGKARRLADYRVRVLDQFPADALEAALNEMAADGFVLAHCTPVCVEGEPITVPNIFPGQQPCCQVPTQKAAFHCVFMRPRDSAHRLPGDEWKGDAEEEES